VAFNGGITLHQKCLYGANAHHITEALFKSLGLAMKDGLKVEGTQVVSTKGVL
jgi:imidazoleglycerol-phosphate dehydratase